VVLHRYFQLCWSMQRGALEDIQATEKPVFIDGHIRTIAWIEGHSEKDALVSGEARSVWLSNLAI